MLTVTGHGSVSGVSADSETQCKKKGRDDVDQYAHVVAIPPGNSPGSFPLPVRSVPIPRDRRAHSIDKN